MATNNQSGRSMRAFKLFSCFFIPAAAALGLGYVFSGGDMDRVAENQTVWETGLNNAVFKSDFFNYLNSLKNEMGALSSNPLIKKLSADLTGSYEKLGVNASSALIKKYVPIPEKPEADNTAKSPNDGDAANGQDAAPAAAPEQAVTPPANPTNSEALAAYDSLHSAYDPVFAQLAKTLGLYDILIIDPRGNVIYSHAKAGDFAGNVLNDEKLKDTDLAKIFQEAETTKDGNILHDMSAYAPAGGQPSALLAAPIIDNGNLLGILVFRLGFAPVPSTFNFSKMLKDDENIYLIAENGTPSYSVTGAPLNPGLLDFAKSGNHLAEIAPGEKRAVSAEAIEFLGNKWLLVSELNVNYRAAEAINGLKQELLYKFAGIAAAVGVLFLILGFLFGRRRREVMIEDREVS